MFFSLFFCLFYTVYSSSKLRPTEVRQDSFLGAIGSQPLPLTIHPITSPEHLFPTNAFLINLRRVIIKFDATGWCAKNAVCNVSYGQEPAMYQCPRLTKARTKFRPCKSNLWTTIRAHFSSKCVQKLEEFGGLPRWNNCKHGIVGASRPQKIHILYASLENSLNEGLCARWLNIFSNSASEGSFLNFQKQLQKGVFSPILKCWKMSREGPLLFQKGKDTELSVVLPIL